MYSTVGIGARKTALDGGGRADEEAGRGKHSPAGGENAP